MPLKAANPPITAQSQQPPLHDDAPLERGLNAKHSPRWIPDNQAALLKSFSLADVTRPARRTGYEENLLGKTGIDAGLQSKRIGGLSYLNPSTGQPAMVINIPDNGVGKTFYTDSVVSGAWATAYQSDGTTSWDCGTTAVSAFMSNERLWMVGGGATPVCTMDIAGLLVQSDLGATDAPLGAVDGTTLLNRVFLLVGNVVYWSSLLPSSPNGSFTTATDKLTLSPDKGSKGVAIKPWRDTSLIVFFNDSIEELIVNSSDPTSSIRNVIEPNYGCGSRDSVVVVGEDMYFIDQYGHLRSLRRTSQGIIQGVVATPFSDMVRNQLPGNLNRAQLNKVRCHLNDDKLEVYYPAALAKDADTRLRWDFSQQLWTGPDALGHPVGQLLSSNIRGQGTETYSTNGNSTSPTATVYRWDDETWSDDGTAIVVSMDTKAFTMSFPEAVKGWLYFELEYHGDVGATPTVSYRLDEIGDYTALTVDNGDASLPAGDDSDWPLLLADFPLALADFPLIYVAPPIGRARYILEAGAIAKSRSVQFRIEESTADVQFEIVAWRLAGQPKFISKEGHYGD